MSKNWKRWSWLFALALPIALIAVHKLPGKLAVAKLCESDGGIKIHATTDVDGYYDLRVEGLCGGCIDHLARGEFGWIGVKTDPRHYGLAGDKAYFRLMVLPEGDVRCSANATRLAQRRLVGKRRLPKEQCIALVPDGPEPTGYVVERSFRMLPAKWHNPIEVYDFRIYDARSGQTMAEYRGYSYTASVSKFFDMGSRVGNPDATCNNPPQNTLLTDTLIRQVLRSDSDARQLHEPSGIPE